MYIEIINSRQQVKGKLGHVGTNSRLPFEVNMMANLSINHSSFGFFVFRLRTCCLVVLTQSFRCSFSVQVHLEVLSLRAFMTALR